MALGISVSLIGVPPVQSAQIAVTGLVAGDVVAVWREWDGHSELVRGAYGATSLSTAMVLGDISVPFGIEVTYRAQVGGEQVTDTITVPEVDGGHVLSDPLTGEYVLVRQLVAGGDDRGNEFRGSVLRPAGRDKPVAIYDVRSADAGSWLMQTRTAEATAALKALLAAGGPLVHRPGSPGLLDFPATEVIQPLSVTRSLLGVDGRTWSIPYEVVDEPDPDLAVSLSTLQDLADAYDTLTLDDLATDFAGLTLLDVATTDWASL